MTKSKPNGRPSAPGWSGEPVEIAWLPVSRQNRRDQLDWLRARNGDAAIAMGDAIMAALGRVRDFPNSGRPGRVLGTRELVVAGTPYLIIYRVEAEAITILRLLHGAQRWPDLP